MAKADLKERLRKKKQELKARSQQGAVFFQKADTTVRMRILNMGEEEEFIKEVIQFYLGDDIKGMISPSTYGLPCAVMEAYETLKDSDDDDDKELANKFSPRNRYLAYCLIYKDDRDKEINESISPKFMLLTGGVYQEILDLYLDETEWGDMTNPEEGYDLKIKRVGSGKKDTEYTVTACKNTSIPKKYYGPYNLDDEIKKIIPTYERTKMFIDQYLGLSSEEEDESEPSKSTRTQTGGKKVIKKNILKKRSKGDLDE